MKCIAELIGDVPNGRKMIAWGRRIWCADAGHGFDPSSRKVVTRLLIDDSIPSQHSYLLELVDNPDGLRAINPAGVLDDADPVGLAVSIALAVSDIPRQELFLLGARYLTNGPCRNEHSFSTGCTLL